MYTMGRPDKFGVSIFRMHYCYGLRFLVSNAVHEVESATV